MAAPPRSSRITRWLTWITILAVMGVSLGALLRLALRSAPDAGPAATVSNAPDVKIDFSLIDHRGTRVTADTYRGKWLLVFFGFTNCPDVCPTTLAEFAQVMQGLGAEAQRVQPLFITVDPTRDTPDVLAKYVTAFDPRIVGLTGTQEEIARVAKPLGVYFERTAGEGDPQQYSVSHTSYTFLFDPSGRMAEGFGYDKTVDEVVAAMRRIGVGTEQAASSERANIAPLNTAEMSLTNAWVRYLPGGVPAGGYFTLRNATRRAAVLLGASSPAFNSVMMHHTVESGGISKMHPVEHIDVPAGGEVTFGPGGYHLMLMQPVRKIAVGDRIPIALEFANGHRLTAEFDVRGPAGK